MIHRSEASWLLVFLKRTLGQKMGKDFIINLHTTITILYCCDYMNWTGMTMITRLHRNNNSRSWGNCDSYFWSEHICLPVMTTRYHKGVNTRNEMVNTQRSELKKKCAKVRVIYSLMSHLSSFLYMLGIFGIELTWEFDFYYKMYSMGIGDRLSNRSL